MERKGSLSLSIAFVALIIVTGCTINVGTKKNALALAQRGGAQERTPIYKQGNWIIARATIHNHTIYSDGCHTPEDLLELARQQGMAILTFNDHMEDKICIGSEKGICGGIGGVASYGFDNYFDHLKKVQDIAKQEGMVVLRGVEVIPYFYNYGKAPSIVIDGLQDHFTVYGIDDPKILAGIPERKVMSLKPEPIPDEKPWQAIVDYIVDNGGMIQAVHVEDGDDRWYGPAHGQVPPPITNLHRLKHLTGFSALPSAWHEKTGGPGGWWDTTLIEYMAGMRDKPMWASGDTDYHCGSTMAIANTLFYLKEFSEADVLKAMREGRMVPLEGDAFQNTYVSQWSVSDGGKPEDEIMMGRELKLADAPTISFSLDHPVDNCRVKLIRNGVVIKEAEGTKLTFTDQEAGKKKEPVYYRVEVIGPRADRGIDEGATAPQSILFVNPIFVRFAG